MDILNTVQTYKAKQLKKHKTIATIFFVAMATIYIATEVLIRKGYPGWLGYIRAFAEAAMVGALADWFAVTALFHHPLGIKIPHTNLIEKKKKDIGNNLGSFVTENFLTTQNIRPYILQLHISKRIAAWLEKDKNRTQFIQESAKTLENILRKADDQTVVAFIDTKGAELLNKANVHQLLGKAINYLVNQKEHDKIFSFLLEKIKIYIVENEELVKARVKKESGFFVPGFVDNMLANRITVGLANYLHEIQMDANHPIRNEITAQLNLFGQQISVGTKYKDSIENLKNNLLSKEHIQKYATDIWANIKASLLNELANPQSALIQYFDNNLQQLVKQLNTISPLQQKIDHWARLNIYKLIIRNTGKVASLISDTVGNWQGRSLSEKLELEVGKDLQFIRINGTVVGGLVGLLIYTITQLL